MSSLHDYKATGAHLLLCPVLFVQVALPLKLPLALALTLKLALPPLLQVHQMPLENLLSLSRLYLQQGNTTTLVTSIAC